MASTNTFDARVDAYIAHAQPFAQPILIHLRELVHKACPGVVESIKWSRPFFEYKGVILGNVSAFNEHCSFGFWGDEIGAILREANVVQDGGMGSLGRITTVKDLPSNKQMLGWLRQAATFIDTGNHTSVIAARNKVVKAPKSELETPPNSPRPSKLTRKQPKSSPPSAPAASTNTLSGSPKPNAPKPVTNASPKPSNGSPKANNATGNIKTAE
jgi:hypothetical protein